MVLVAGVFVVRPHFIHALDERVCDLLAAWAGSGTMSQKVVLVGIDQPALGRYGRWPWPRDLLGALVDRVADAGAGAVVLDIILAEEDRAAPARRAGSAPPASTNDEALAHALRRIPSVVGYSLRFDGTPLADGCSPPSLPLAAAVPSAPAAAPFFRASGLECVAPAVAAATAGSGSLNAVPGTDGQLRALPLVFDYRGRNLPSLALAAVNAYRPAARMELRAGARGAEWLRLDGRTVPLEGRSLLRLRFRGPRHTFPYVSADDLLGGRVPAERLRGRIAVVGASAYGLQGVVATPVDPLLPDLELHATAIDNLLQGDFFHRPADGYAWEMLLAIAAGVAAVLALASIRSLWALAVAGGAAIVVWAGSALLLASTGAVLSPLPATGVVAAVVAVLSGLNYRRERTRAERTERQLATAHRHTERIRQEGESRYQLLVDNVSDAIITADLEGRLVFANRRFRDWFGLGDCDPRGMALEDHVAPEWRDAVREQHRRRVAGLGVSDFLEYEGVRADGVRIRIEAQVTAVEEGGRIAGTQSALRDVTERKRLEAQYLQAQKLESVGRLAGGVAHDFNNLLTVINGYSEMLASSLKDDPGLRDMAEQIYTAGQRAAELTVQLLTFSRKQVAQRRPVDLSRVVDEAQKMLRRLVGEDIQLQSRLSASLSKVMADPGQMQQILMNLVVNARDSMPEGGQVTIETGEVEVDDAFSRQHPEVPPGRYVHLAVADTGSGMTDEVQQRIFEPFFTTKEKGKGTGLGLATVYSIVRQGEGAVRVESAPGAGSTFHIYLPPIGGDAATEPSATAARLARGSETVLLVEDQDSVRKLLLRMLEDQGYRVLPASDGEAALAIAARHPATIHLLITDVILPQMNGRALADALALARPGIRILYVSGYSEDIIASRGVLDSGVAYLAKPFSLETLVAKVQETLSAQG